MEWLGWLTKPHLQVSLMDRLIMFGEFIVIGGPVVLVWAWTGSRPKRKR